MCIRDSKDPVQCHKDMGISWGTAFEQVFLTLRDTAVLIFKDEVMGPDDNPFVPDTGSNPMSYDVFHFTMEFIMGVWKSTLSQ